MFLFIFWEEIVSSNQHDVRTYTQSFLYIRLVILRGSSRLYLHGFIFLQLLSTATNTNLCWWSLTLQFVENKILKIKKFIKLFYLGNLLEAKTSCWLKMKLAS